MNALKALLHIQKAQRTLRGTKARAPAFKDGDALLGLLASQHRFSSNKENPFEAAVWGPHV